MVRLDGVRAVVTGATGGLGLAMAEALLAEGASVAILGRSGPKLEHASRQALIGGGKALPLRVDVRDAESVAIGAQMAVDAFGGIDIVFNNAGIGMRKVNPRFFVEPQPFFEVPIDGFVDAINTNLVGYFLVARAFAPIFIAQGRGRYVNVTMNHETMKRRGFVPYGPSRAGAESLSLIMVEDMRPYGVNVNMLLPGGATSTGMIPDEMPDSARSSLLPASVMGPPAVFLASSEAEKVTGERIVAKDFDSWLQRWRSSRNR